MTDENSNGTLRRNEFLAERVRQQLEGFPEKFRELGEGGELRKLCREPTTLSGPKVNQAPEDFTEQYLIEPVLHGLGYWNPSSDRYSGTGPHFVRRPSTYRHVEIKRPDYLLKNVSPRLVCFLEAKAANEEQATGDKRRATADIEEYVESDTFAKYLETLEKRYLVAIGTDSFRWVLWAKDVRTGETRPELATVDFSDAIESIAKRDRVIEGEPDHSTTDVRKLIADEFVPAFAARSVTEFVTGAFAD
ncbi:hypothetical protein [Natronococcus jeotgali]|uniref:Uncharacterized protein n=1 Tax=Natronococcus jeotgali DSM 18795 TaxID=1227498 RepID=L9X0L0_9EURY|nr:hypothetical protein [Natronococcus jeotgali]ELY55162.1 hypothetical protein C492_15951 [Natronococcus jeotgali DSM 18795]